MIKNFDWYDVLRLLTSTLAMICVFRLCARARRLWDTYSDYIRDLWWVLVALLFLVIEGSLEQIVQDAPWGPRTLLSAIIVLVCFKATMNKDARLERHDD